MVLLLAGLQAIPRDVYEAAALDGATGWRLLRRITLPLLRNTSVAVLMLQFIAAFQAFDEFYNLFNSGLSGTGTAPVQTPWSTCTTPRWAPRTTASDRRAPSSSPR
ncbi:carbohydrate ABC transporter permease [Kitasatospora aburaviensis]